MTDIQTHVAHSRTLLWPAVFASAAMGLVALGLYWGIHAFTHHRPLGAATLAIISAAAYVLLLAVAWRLRIGRTVAWGALACGVVVLAATAVVAP